MGKVQILAVLTMDGCRSSELYDKAQQDLGLDPVSYTHLSLEREPQSTATNVLPARLLLSCNRWAICALPVPFSPNIMHRIRLVAATDMSVMIFGENGTGKEHHQPICSPYSTILTTSTYSRRLFFPTSKLHHLAL